MCPYCGTYKVQRHITRLQKISYNLQDLSKLFLLTCVFLVGQVEAHYYLLVMTMLDLYVR